MADADDGKDAAMRTVVLLDHGFGSDFTRREELITQTLRDSGVSRSSLEQVVFPVSTRALRMTSGSCAGDSAATFTFSSQQDADVFLRGGTFRYLLPPQMFVKSTVEVNTQDRSAAGLQTMCSSFGVSMTSGDSAVTSSISGAWYRVQALWEHLLVTGAPQDGKQKFTQSMALSRDLAEYVQSKQPRGLFPKCEGCQVTIHDRQTFFEVLFCGKSAKACNKAKKHFTEKMKKVEIEEVPHVPNQEKLEKKFGDVAFMRDRGSFGMTRVAGQRKSMRKMKKVLQNADDKPQEAPPGQPYDDRHSGAPPISDARMHARHDEDATEAAVGQGNMLRGRRQLDEDRYNAQGVHQLGTDTPPEPASFQSRQNTHAQVHILQHDITKLLVDVIVNAANSQLQHGAGVARAIADAAGRDMEHECQQWIRKNKEIPVTQHAWTSAGKLPCKQIMHAVGPMYDRNLKQIREQELYETFFNCLKSAAKRKLRSIALPAISSGAFGFPNDTVATIASQSIAYFLAQSFNTTLVQIYLVDVRPEMVNLFLTSFSAQQEFRKQSKFYGNIPGEITGAASQYVTDPPVRQEVTASPQKEPQEPKAHATSDQPVSFVSLHKPGAKVHIVKHDITTMAVDVIVNASNYRLRHRAGVSRAIATAAGQSMQRECENYIRSHGTVPVGSHVSTGPGNLKCKMVLHAVGPVYDDQKGDECKVDLWQTVNGCLVAANQVGYKSIAFPSISSGGHGAPLRLVCEVIADSIVNHLKESTSLQNIYLVDISPDTVRSFLATFSARTADFQQVKKFEGNWKGELGYPDQSVQLIDLYSTQSPATQARDTRPLSEYANVQGYALLQAPGLQVQAQAHQVQQQGYQDIQQGRQWQRQDHQDMPLGRQWHQQEHQDTQQGLQWQHQDYQRQQADHTVHQQILPGAQQGLERGQQGLRKGHQGQQHVNYVQSMQVPQGPQQDHQPYYAANHHQGNTRVHQQSGGQALVNGHHHHVPHGENDSPVHQGNVRTMQLATMTASVKPTGAADECAICTSPIDNPKTLAKCKHTFCQGCIDNWFTIKPSCPICGEVYGKLTGTQPRNGSMLVKRHSYSVPGYHGHGCIEITYYFPDGKQEEEHPNPGQRYRGLTRSAYLPGTAKGEQVLRLLREAFDSRLVFTVGRSVTSGRDNMVTWNDIHHKTNIDGGPQCYGYPDDKYLDRVLEELAAKGVK